MGGYAGKLLRVDLTTGAVADEPLPSEEILRRYVGGLGLGAWIVYNEVPLTVNALDPENRLVFMTGPITGTTVMSSSDWTVVSIRHELDGKTILGSHSHGYWGAFLKMNGYDGIIFQGASPTPVYLSIRNGKAELRDASKIWGEDTHDTEDAVKADLGGNPADLSVAAIGPAGENLVPSALIENDKHHSASKGMGAIMGAKKLKAIAVNRGPWGVKVADPQGLLDVSLEWRNTLAGTHIISHAVRGAIPNENSPIFTCGKNFSDPLWARDVFRAGLMKESQKYEIDSKGCWNCSSPCSYRLKISTGPHAGYEATLAGGHENTEGAAAMAGVEDPGTAFYLTDLVDRLGMDGSPVACAMGLAIECYEKGILTKGQTGGLELRWNDGELTEKLWRLAAAREGFGAVLAEGPRYTAEFIGGEALNMVVHVKGTGPNLHDWRSRPSIILAQMTSPAGPCWQGGLGVELGPEPDGGIEQPWDAWKQDGKGKAITRLQMRATFEDCNGICWFGFNLPARRVPGYYTWLARTIACATGWSDFSPEEVIEVGERVMNLQRVHAIRRGMTKADDLDVGPRFVEPHSTGPTTGLDIRPHLQGLVEEFYEGMGWDKETGRPLPGTLSRLDLDFLIADLYPQSGAVTA